MSVSTPERFFLACYRPIPPSGTVDLEALRTDGVDVNPRVTSLQWTTQLPGGFGSLSVGLDSETALDDGGRREMLLTRSLAVPAKGHVAVSSPNGSALLWEGQRTAPLYRNGRLRGFQAEGYGTVGLEDSTVTNAPTALVSGQNALRYALLTATPPYAIGDVSRFVDPGVAHYLSEYEGQAPSQVVAQLTQEGGDVNVQFNFTVYGEGDGRRLAAFVPRRSITQPTYQIPEDTTVERNEDDKQLFSSIVLNYTDFTSGVRQTITQSNPLFAGKYGFLRQKPVDGGTKTFVGAHQYVKTWLNLHGNDWISIKVTRDRTRGVELYGSGAERPAWFVRAGEWVQVGADPNEVYVIIRTTYAAHTGMFEMELGQPSPGFESLLADIRAVTAAVRRGMNPNTGSIAA